MTRDKNMNETDDKTMDVRRRGSGELSAAGRDLRPGLYPDHMTTLPGSAVSGSVWAHYLEKNRARTVDYCPRMFDFTSQAFVPLVSSGSLNERIQTRPNSELATDKAEKSRSKISESAHIRARLATGTESHDSSTARLTTRPESYHSFITRSATRPKSCYSSATRPESCHSFNLQPATRPESCLASTARPATLAGPPRQCRSASAGKAGMSSRNHEVSDGKRFSSNHRSQIHQPSNGICSFERNVCKNGVTVRPVSSLYHFLQNRRQLLEDVRAVLKERRVSSAAPRSATQPAASTHSCDNPDIQGANLSPDIEGDPFNLKSLAKFRELGRSVVHLLRVMKAIVHNCSDKTLKSANELQWKHVYAEKHDVTLAFNKHLYSRDRVGAHVPDWAVSILDLSPSERTEQECRRLHALLRGLTSFDKFTCEIQMSLCRAFTLARVAEGRVVLKSGHVGVNFYFIYTGSVFVNVEDTTREGRKFMRTMAILTRGESFGELALLQDIRRTATISVREKCELLVVDKHVFASVCPQIFERELAEKYTFLRLGLH